LHHEDFKLADIVDNEFLESIGEHMSSLCVWSISDVWHQVLSLKATTDTVINTFWLTPAWLQTEININVSHGSCLCWLDDSKTHLNFVISVRLMANEMLRSLLHNFGLECWSDCHFIS
jgi:hypothetical protein